MSESCKVLIAGIGGASLGTEILKCLVDAGGYRIFGCDISELAFGHYGEGFEKTYLADRDRYVDSLLQICGKVQPQIVVPGAEQPTVLLADAAARFEEQGIRLAINSPDVIKTCSDKAACFRKLDELGIPTPRTVTYSSQSSLDGLSFPAIVKPSTGSGGSDLVMLATDAAEAELYADFLTKNGRTAVIQEYIPEDEGEFTVGVLSSMDRVVAGSVALKRTFQSKLTVASRSSGGLVSSGYSQGLVDDFPEVRASCEDIAAALGSAGPLNVQGRCRNGQFLPFEINPRFSASVYLRALAGVNEIDAYIRSVVYGESIRLPKARTGYVLRSLDEVFVSGDAVLRPADARSDNEEN